MRYRIAKSNFGSFGVVFSPELQKAIRIILPGTKESVTAKLKELHPLAKKDATGMNDLVEMISSALSGADVVIPLDFVDTTQVTPFQLRVLKAEHSIPRGKAASYAWLARTARTKAIRAAGSVLARNPFPIVVPCHRAVRSTRHIGQYQGGPEMKRKLLIMEGVDFDDSESVSVDCFLP